MFTRKSGILALVLSAFVLGACEDDEPFVQPDPATVTITPQTVPVITVPNTFQLAAVTTNFPAGATVQFTSSNPAIASVNASTGLVTCVTAGTVTIIARSSVDANVQNAVAVTCQSSVVGPGPGQPTISISRITNTAGQDVNPGNVSGVVNVVMNVDIPTGVTASFVRVMVGNTEVCRSTFTGSTEAAADAAAAVPVTVVCSFNTAQLNAQGQPLFPNASVVLRAEVVNPQGTVIAQATSQTLVFNNPSTLGISVTANCAGATTCPNTDQNGLLWHTGDLTVTITPQIFQPGSPTTSNVQITITDTNTGLRSTQPGTLNATTGAFTAVFLKANTPGQCLAPAEVAGATCGTDGTAVGGASTNGVASFEGSVTVSATSVVGGQPGPTNIQGGLIRLDNDAPDLEGAEVSAFASNNFFFGATAPAITAAGLLTGVPDDEGVNRNVVRFQFNPSPTATQTTAGFTTFTAASELPAGTSPSAFSVRAVVCDVLDNCTNIGATGVGTTPIRAGADVTAPTITDVTVDPDSIDEVQGDAGAELSVTATESGSGFPANFTQVRIIRTTTTTGGTQTQVCLDPASGAVIESAPGVARPITATQCFVGQATGTVDLTAAHGEGFFEISARAVDVAGNVSALVTRQVLVDPSVPAVTVSGLTFTSNQVSVSGTVTDANDDLAGHDTREFFATGDARFATTGLPLTTMSAGGTFGLPLTTSITAAGTVPIIRGVNAGGTFTAGAPLSGVGFGATDLANNFGSGQIGFTATPGDFGTPAEVVSFAAPTNSRTTLCRSGNATACTGTGGEPSTANTSATVTAEVVTAVNTANPVATTHFFALIPATNGVTYPLLIGSDASADLLITDPVTNQRRWQFTTTLNASQLPPVPNPNGTYSINVFAVAVDAQGDAIASANSAAIVIH